MKVKLTNVSSSTTEASTPTDKTHYLHFAEVVEESEFPAYPTARGSLGVPATAAEAEGYAFDTEYEVTITPAAG